jgi:hypothetical protein
MEARPSPSRLTATSTAVSFVVRFTDAVRIIFSATRAFYQGFERFANRRGAQLQ